MEYKDYYKILGVSKDATEAEIKKAFRKLAMKYHPDKNHGDKNAEKMFHDVNEAHEVLSDAEKRKKYDRFGQDRQHYQHAGAGTGAGGRGGYSWSNFGQGGNKTYETMFDLGDMFGNSSSDDFFEMLFGHKFRGSTSRAGQFKGSDALAEAPISLEEAYHGTTRMLNVNGQTIRVNIKPGTADGQNLRIPGKGEAGINGRTPGDLFIKVQLLPHETFERKGDDLYCTIPVDLYSAILGGSVPFKTLKGMINLKIPPESENGQVLKLTGLGMPLCGNKNTFGNLYAKIEVQLPRHLDSKEKKMFEELRQYRK
jgi:curved DNA-binding protein